MDNIDVFVRELDLAGSVLRRNRHSSHDGRWFGPDPEPNSPGVDCECAGCWVRFPRSRH